MNVLLPPGYTTEKQYPVVYVLHGYFGDENAMTINAFGITRMLTKFYAENKAKEMIVVCPYIFTSKELRNSAYMIFRNLGDCLSWLHLKSRKYTALFC